MAHQHFCEVKRTLPARKLARPRWACARCPASCGPAGLAAAPGPHMPPRAGCASPAALVPSPGKHLALECEPQLGRVCSAEGGPRFTAPASPGRLLMSRVLGGRGRGRAAGRAAVLCGCACGPRRRVCAVKRHCCSSERARLGLRRSPCRPEDGRRALRVGGPRPVADQLPWTDHTRCPLPSSVRGAASFHLPAV